MKYGFKYSMMMVLFTSALNVTLADRPAFNWEKRGEKGYEKVTPIGMSIVQKGMDETQKKLIRLYDLPYDLYIRPPIASFVPSLIKQTTGNIGKVSSQLLKQVGGITPNLGEAAGNTVTQSGQALGNIVSSAVSAIGTSATSIAQQVPVIGPTISPIISALSGPAGELATQVINAGAGALAAGLTAIGNPLDSAADVSSAFFNALGNEVSKPIQSIIEMFIPADSPATTLLDISISEFRNQFLDKAISDAILEPLNQMEQGVARMIFPNATDEEIQEALNVIRKQSRTLLGMSSPSAPASKLYVDNSLIDVHNRIDQVEGKVEELDTRVNQFEHKLNKIDKESKAGTASAIAIAGLPQATDAGNSMVAASVGQYSNQTAVAVGLSHVSESGNYVVKGSLTGNTSKKYGGSVGFGYQW